MSHEELNTTLSQLASAASDRNSCVRPSRDCESVDLDDMQELEVTAACCSVIIGLSFIREVSNKRSI